MENFTNKKELVKHINKIRLDNKNKWYWIDCKFMDQVIKIKAYNTWLQIYIINDLNYGNCMDRTIADFKKDILLPFSSYED